MTLLIIPPNPATRGRAGQGTAGEANLGAPNRYTYDFKPAAHSDPGKFRRLPWFIFGLGVPLLCVGFIAPKNQLSTSPAPVAIPGQSVPGQQVSDQQIPDQTGIVAATSVASDNPADAGALPELSDALDATNASTNVAPACD